MISPLYGQLSPIRVPTKAVRKLSDDADANAYLLAVEAADGQELESGVITAIETFVTGCKSDGIWSAIKASCILAGARTLSGALVPLAGTAPTNSNFVSADYNRETGLKGGSTKRISTNRNNNDDPQDNSHRAVFRTETTLPASYAVVLGRNQVGGNTQIGVFSSGTIRFDLNTSAAPVTISNAIATGLSGVKRSTSASFDYYHNKVNATRVGASVTPLASPLRVFCDDRNSSFSLDRISFYSIGESLDLALLDTRVSTLMTDLAAAIP